MRRQVHGFFYAPTIYGGRYIGELRSSPVLLPVCQPDILPTAKKFDSFRRWFKTI